MATTTRPAYGNGGGVDYRVDARDRAYQDFSASVYVRQPKDQDENASRCVEVQAFRPSTSGGGRSLVSVVSIVLHSGYGLADIMLSAAEAREVAIALIMSAAEADAQSADTF
jgi:hypothetical protein